MMVNPLFLPRATAIIITNKAINIKGNDILFDIPYKLFLYFYNLRSILEFVNEK
uniref:hypothetical protein n=1 Tax=Lactococcus sp. TaxID=44273 RepID=UPI0032427B0B